MEEWYESSNSQDVLETFYDQYKAPGQEGARNTKYKYCETHNHWYSPKYGQCWYCWRGTSKTKERRLNRLATRVSLGESTWPLQ